MKLSKNILIVSILITLFTLTACDNTTAYINDQTGKEISVTTSDDTYTFKLPAAESEESVTSEPEAESVSEIKEPTATVVESDGTNTDSEGPKTGEP